MAKIINIKESVTSLLDQAEAENRPQPTLRTLRGLIGGGSFSTISQAVKEWRVSKLQEAGSLPQGFDEQAARNIADTVWQAVLPTLQASIEAVQKAAEARIDAERTEAAKLSEAASEMLAEAAMKDDALAAAEAKARESASALDKANAELEEARHVIASLKEDLEHARAERDKAMKEAAAANASADAIRRLVPFLDPKHLAKAGKSGKQF